MTQAESRFTTTVYSALITTLKLPVLKNIASMNFKSKLVHTNTKAKSQPTTSQK